MFQFHTSKPSHFSKSISHFLLTLSDSMVPHYYHPEIKIFKKDHR